MISAADNTSVRAARVSQTVAALQAQFSCSPSWHLWGRAVCMMLTTYHSVWCPRRLMYICLSPQVRRGVVEHSAPCFFSFLGGGWGNGAGGVCLFACLCKEGWSNSVGTSTVPIVWVSKRRQSNAPSQCSPQKSLLCTVAVFAAFTLPGTRGMLCPFHGYEPPHCLQVGCPVATKKAHKKRVLKVFFFWCPTSRNFSATIHISQSKQHHVAIVLRSDML